MTPSKHCVLIGGLRQIGCEPSIDDYVFQLARRKTFCRMKALHIGVCNGDAPKDEHEFEEAYGRRGFLVRHARIFRNPEDIKNIQFAEQDVIYLSGGNPSIPLLYEEQVPKKFSLRRRLQEAYDAGVIIVGNSAGAIALGRCWAHPESTELESAGVYDALQIIDNIAVFAHFEEYSQLFCDRDGSSVPPEQFLRRIHPVLKKRAGSTANFYSFGIWENSALSVSWTGSEASEHCTARSIGEKEVLYMNGNPAPEVVRK